MKTDIIQTDLNEALKSRNGAAVTALRMLLARLQQEEKRNGSSLDEQAVLACVRSQIKKYKEAADSFRQVGMEEKAVEEETQQQQLLKYLPAQLPAEQLQEIIRVKIQENSWQTKDFGTAMKLLKQEFGNQTSGEEIAKILKDLL